MKPVAAPISWNFAQLSGLQDSPGAHPFLSSSGSQSEQGLRVVSKFDFVVGMELELGFWGLENAKVSGNAVMGNESNWVQIVKDR